MDHDYQLVLRRLREERERRNLSEDEGTHQTERN